MRSLLSFLILALTVHPCHAWSPCGHHMIAVLPHHLLPRAVEPLAQQSQFGFQPDTIRVTGRTGSTDQIDDSRVNFDCLGSHATIRSYHHRVDGGMPEKHFEQDL